MRRSALSLSRAVLQLRASTDLAMQAQERRLHTLASHVAARSGSSDEPHSRRRRAALFFTGAAAGATAGATEGEEETGSFPVPSIFLARADAAAQEAAKEDAAAGLFPDESYVTNLFRRAAPSVVHIRTSAVARFPFTQDLLEIPQGAGSGFVWDTRGHIVTNWHVVRGASRARVTLSDNTTWDAELVGAEPDKDVAVLRLTSITSPASDPENGFQALPAPAASPHAKPELHPLAVGTSKELLVGQRVFAIGNPFGLDRTLTQGIVSGVGRDIRALTGRSIRGVIQTDASVNPGNSGGPLLDSRGRLVGVNTVILSPTGAWSGVGFAVPVDTVRRVVDALINEGRVTKPALGLHCAADAQARQLRLPRGVLVIETTPGGAAEKAGLRGTGRDWRGALVLGDVITALDGAPVASLEDLLAAVEERRVGEAVQLSVLREGRERRFRVTLGERAPAAEQ